MSGDNRRPLLPPTSPRALPSRSEDNDSWLDFLRTAGGTVDTDHSSSTDRKRPHAGSSPERRPYPHRVAWSRSLTSAMDQADAAGSSRETAIDLTTPPRQPPRPPRSMSGNEGPRISSLRPPISPLQSSHRASSTGRQGSDVIIPNWQPDIDVDRCPVCQADFSFWYRKHHCRKCGRVVCAACSPHRITIPRQYIVQPPNFSESDYIPISPSGNPFAGLGGGEIVRVCNPCVPDPWTPPDVAAESPRAIQDPRRRDSNDILQRHDGYRPVPPPPLFQYARARPPIPQPPGFSRSLPHGPAGPNFAFAQPPNRAPPPPPHHSRPAHHRYTQSSSSAMMPPAHSAHAVRQPVSPSTMAASSAAPQIRQRREVREEDECPVCGNELPPGEGVREAHIQQCITARFSSTPSSAPPAPPRSSSMRAQAPSTEVRNDGARPSESSRPRATSFRPRGMAVYRATEKDCVTENDEPQECVICFEEFQPGEEMGRMECLCKFHRVCIRQWWDTKGVGSCPTHMLHE